MQKQGMFGTWEITLAKTQLHVTNGASQLEVRMVGQCCLVELYDARCVATQDENKEGSQRGRQGKQMWEGTCPIVLNCW